MAKTSPSPTHAASIHRPPGDATQASCTPHADEAANPWDAAATGWDRHTPMLRDWLHEATTALLDAAHVKPGAQVLDVAAGAGDQTLDIAGRVGPAGRVLATDLSPAILARAQARLQGAGLVNVGTQVADAQALGQAPGVAAVVAAGGFDSVVCRLGLMFCATPLAALASARAALKPGGRYAALVFAGPQDNPCIALMAATARRHAGLAPASAFEPGGLLSLGQTGALAALLGEAGFEQVAVQAVSAPMHLPSVQHYLAFVQSAGLPIMALLAPLPPAAQQAAWQDIAQQLARFNTATGWSGPNGLLLCAGSRPQGFDARP